MVDRSKREMPTREALWQFAQQIPEINVSAVEVLLQFLQASQEIQHYIFDILEKNYKISSGKLSVMVILYQSADGIAPSQLAETACVTRATISVMLSRMIRDGLVDTFSDHEDGRGKFIALTAKGRGFMDEILPGHFLRIARLMSDLTEEERNVLIQLLKKITTGQHE